MPSMITNPELSSNGWVSIGEGEANFTVINTSRHPILIAVADLEASIDGTIALQPGDAVPLNSVPVSTFVFGKVIMAVKKAGQVPEPTQAEIAVYKS